MAGISIDRVTKRFGAVTAVRDLSLEVRDREFVTLLGPSGCGKTTLLRLIAGFAAPDEGTIRTGDVTLSTPGRVVPPERRGMGMVFQSYAIWPHLTVFENVAFPLREHSDLPDSMIRDIVLMKLNAVGLRGAAPLRISQVSGGMARRIALARAIALDPELIMYDEPFAGLDPISMGVAANLIRKLNDTTGATSLIVSHDVQECFSICDYAYLLSTQGRVVAHGRPDELRASAHPEVRQFIGGEPDGPVRFHYPAPPLAQDLGLAA
jgi:phospholipid/cholesterol/gamma-HCH transport system ATP-binding protein